MKKERPYSLSRALLEEYLNAALQNSRELLTEATILLSQKRYARAYFLACASLEETGKAHSAFLAMGRNLKNPGVQAAVKASFEDHQIKIISATYCLLKSQITNTERAKEFVKLTLNLKIGRETSIYVDINEEQEITIPSKVIRPKAAFEAVRLAEECLKTTGKFIKQNKPDKSTPSQDKLITLKRSRLLKMVNTQDFWEFYIDQIKKEKDIAEIFVNYHDQYFCKNKLFKKIEDHQIHSTGHVGEGVRS